LIFCWFPFVASGQQLHISDLQSTNITTESADIQWTIANDTGQGATHVVFYWDDSMGGPGTWTPGYAHDGWSDPAVWHEGYCECIWHEGWWENTTWHEGWWEYIWHEGHYEYVYHEGHYETTTHDGWFENVWHDGYYEQVDHEGYWEGATWHDPYIELVWHEGYWGTEWRDPYTETIYHEGYYDQIWHEGFYEDVWREGYWENSTWHEGFWDQIWHEGYNEQVWHDGYWQNSTWHDGYYEYVNHDGWYQSVWHEGYTEQVWHDSYTDDDGVWHDGYTEYVSHEGYWEQVWHDGYTEQIWHEGYWDQAWHDGYSETVWHEGWWENFTWHEGYWDQVWHDGYNEQVWHEGWWEDFTWHDGYYEYIDHPGGYVDVWHEGYVEPVYHDGYWDGGEWQEGWTEYVWHDPYYAQVWHDGYTEQVWVDSYWETIWHDPYYEQVYHDGYWDQVWHDGYYEHIWHEGYFDPAVWHPAYWVKGHWDGGGSFLVAYAVNDPGNGTVTVSLPNLQHGHTYYYFAKSVLPSASGNPDDPNNDNPVTTATAPGDGTFLQFTTLNDPIHFTAAPTVSEQTGTNVVVTFNFVNETGNTIHHFVTYNWNGVNGLASSDFSLDSPPGSNQVSIGFNNLIAGTDYTYSIVSVVDGHSAGEAGYSISVGGSFSTPALMTAENLHYENLSTNSVSVVWNFQNDSPYTATHSVTLESADVSTNLTFNTDAGPGGTNILFAVQGLAPGDYIVTVQSFLNDPDGYGEDELPGYSLIGMDFVTVPDGPLITMSGLHYENLTANSVDVVWNFAATNDYFATHTLYYTTGDSSTTVNGPYLPLDYPDSGEVRITVSDFQPSSTNLVVVQSVVGLSGYDPSLTSAAGSLTVVTPAAVTITSAPVRSVVSGSAGGYSTTLAWTFQNNTYQPVTHVVDYAWFTPDASGTGEIIASSDPGVSSASVTIPNLQPQATYMFSVNSGFADGDFIAAFAANTLGVFTTEDIAPSPGISIFNVSANPDLIADNSAVITWSVAYAGSNVFAPHNHFVVLSSNAPPTELNQSVIATGFEASDNPSNVTALLTGLAPGQTNFFFVQSVGDPFPGHYATDLNGGAFYSFTNTAAGATDTNVPSAITISQSPSTVFVTNTSALISWQVASSDDNPTNHTHFLVLSESATPVSTNAVVTLGAEDSNGQVFAHLTGLWPGRTYYYYVQSFSDSGLGSASTDDNSGQFYSFSTDNTPVADATSIFGSNGTGGTGGSGSGGSGGSGGWTSGGGFVLNGTGSGQYGDDSGTNGLRKADAKNTSANVTCFFDVGTGPTNNVKSGTYKVRLSCQGADEPYELTADALHPSVCTNCSFKLTPGQEYNFSVEELSRPDKVGKDDPPNNVTIWSWVSQLQSIFDMGGGYTANYLWKHADCEEKLWEEPIWNSYTNPPTSWTMAIPKADLVAMNLKNGEASGEVSEEEEEKTGAFLPCLSNPNAAPVLLPIKLKAIQPASMEGYYYLSMDAKLKFWKTKNRSPDDRVTGSTPISATTDTTLYVEGVGSGVATISITWKEHNDGTPGEIFANLDRVKITVQPVQIKTKTKATLPENRERRRIGIGEEVRIELASPAGAKVTWAVKSGKGNVSHPADYPADAAMFTASGQEGKAVVEGTLTDYDNAKVSVEFEVIPPKTVTLKRVSGLLRKINTPGFGFELQTKWFFGPDDVCFYNVVGGETGCEPKRKGVFEQNYYNTPHKDQTLDDDGHWLTNQVVPGKGTMSLGEDWYRYGAFHTPPKLYLNQTGRIEWNVQWKYRLKSETGGNGTPFYPMQMWMEIVPEKVPGQGINGFTAEAGKGDIKLTVTPDE